MRQNPRAEPKTPSADQKLLNRRRIQQNLEEQPKPLFEYWEVLKRRRLRFLVPAIGIALVMFSLAIAMPPIYRSEATILIEDQEIPEDFVGTAITSYASQQIQLISRRLLTAKNIQGLVEKFNIYESMDEEGPGSAMKVVKKFREDMELDLVSAAVIDSRGQWVEATIAFTLAFESKIPEISQSVTEELVSLFLDENRRSSISRTTGVSDFLKQAVNDANEDLIKLEAELAEFKARNEGTLPELRQINLNVINRTDEQLSDINFRIQQMRQRKIQLSAQLASISPSAPVTLPSGETIMSDQDRLRALQIDFRRKKSIYQADHPDLIKLKREILLLQSTVGDTGDYELLQKQLRQERERLSMLEDRYSDDHPDIKNSRAAIAEIETQLAAASRQDSTQTDTADNPAYVLINTQLQSTDLEIENLLQKRSVLQAKVAEYEALLRQAPQVEMQYEALLRRSDNARTKHGDLQTKLRLAEVGADVEQEITGRRFTLIEPPVLPVSASGPNRKAFLMMGLFLAAGIGIGFVVLAEITDNSIHSAKRLAEIAGSPPLVVIPYLDNRSDVVHTRLQRTYLISAFFGACILCVVYILYTRPSLLSLF